jgi:hypothetical protein
MTFRFLSFGGGGAAAGGGQAGGGSGNFLFDIIRVSVTFTSFFPNQLFAIKIFKNKTRDKIIDPNKLFPHFSLK